MKMVVYEPLVRFNTSINTIIVQTSSCLKIEKKKVDLELYI